MKPQDTAIEQRIYARDIAEAKGVSMRRAHQILAALERQRGAGTVGRDGRRLFTTSEAMLRLSVVEGRDELAVRLDAHDAKFLEIGDDHCRLERDLDLLRARVERLERSRPNDR